MRWRRAGESDFGDPASGECERAHERGEGEAAELDAACPEGDREGTDGELADRGGYEGEEAVDRPARFTTCPTKK